MVAKFPKNIRNIPNVMAFFLFCVPFTLITIGDFTLWLIVKFGQFIRFLVKMLKTLLLLPLRIVAQIFKTTGKMLHLLLNRRRREITSVSPVVMAEKIVPPPQKPRKKYTFLLTNTAHKRGISRAPLPSMSVLQRIAWFTLGIIAACLFIFLPYEIYQFLHDLPHPSLLTNRPIPVTTKIFDRSGTLLFEFYGDQNRKPVTLDQIPLTVKQATIAIEDREFYNHLGFSPRGIIRAARETFINKQLQGGSTLTQQLIKNALLTPQPTLTRKIKELILSFWTERLYTKNQILEMYFNQVPYGGTYWGIEAASQGYFGKSVTNLTLGEAAFLAGLPAAPTLYSPFGSRPDQAIERQREVLGHMVEEGYISQKDAAEARDQKLVFVPQILPIKAPHFVMYVKELLNRRYGLRAVEQGGLRVKTSLDLPTQGMAEEVLSTELDKLTALQVTNGGVLITDPRNGDILAMVGSKNYFDIQAQGNVNTTLALRQPGSSIKVVTYAAALEGKFTAASILDDSPITYIVPGQAPYTPVNYDGRFHGKVPLRYALANSYNIPAVKVAASIGMDALIAQGRKMGIGNWQDTSRFGLSLTLGAGEVTMTDLATVYGVLANGGKRVDVNPILEVTTYKGDVLEQKDPSTGTQVVSSAVAFILSDILSDNLARSQAFGPNSSLVIPNRQVAVKTGTSNDKRDNWTIGYTPWVLTAVWVGNNDGSPMNPVLTSGVTGAAPIWQQVMIRLVKDRSNETFTKPENVVAMPCFFGRLEYFISGTQPKGGCPLLSPPSMPPPSPTP